MLYAILAYHVEAEVMSWTPEEDAALMTNLLQVHDRLDEKKLLGPAARLGATANARTLRGPGDGMVLDGPFAETKEQLLGLYVVNCADEDGSDRRGPRPAPRQSDGGLRDPPDPALSPRRAVAGDRRTVAQRQSPLAAGIAAASSPEFCDSTPRNRNGRQFKPIEPRASETAGESCRSIA